MSLEIERIGDKFSFIIGADRSGTTLLSNILNNHPDIIAPPEQEFLMSLLYKYAGRNTLSEKEIEEIISNLWIRKREFKKIWNLDTELLRKKLVNQNQNIESILESIFVSYDLAKEDNYRMILDKNPVYSEYLEGLRSQFPGSKYVAIVRDFRDRYVSLKTNKGSTYSFGLMGILKWKYYYNSIRKFKERYPDEIIVVKYENLINEPDNTIGEICEFLGLRRISELYNFPLREIKVDGSTKSDQKFNQMHSLSSKPISKNKIGIWKNQLAQNETKLLVHFCAKEAEFYGYGDFVKLTHYEKIVYTVRYFYAPIQYRMVTLLNRLGPRLPFWIQKRLVDYFRDRIK
ncbi:MAG: sulfotransferase [Flavobacteriales bacterium]|nr:sulfotransferase [Flavobacteriales bacterium]